MRLLFQLCVVALAAAWPSARAQEIAWPSAPERTVWLAAVGASFGDGSTASEPVDVSTAAKLGQALDR